MDFLFVYYISHLGQDSFVDILSFFLSSRIFLAMLRLFLMSIVVWKYKKQRKLLLLSFFVSGILFFLVSEIGFKMLLVYVRGLRIRPYLAFPELIHAIGYLYTDTSFPSSHMAIVSVLMTVVVYFLPRVWPIALSLILMMAFSRIHNGMHYPSDVLVGTFLGIFYGVLAVWIAKKWIRK